MKKLVLIALILGAIAPSVQAADEDPMQQITDAVQNSQNEMGQIVTALQNCQTSLADEIRNRLSQFVATLKQLKNVSDSDKQDVLKKIKEIQSNINLFAQEIDFQLQGDIPGLIADLDRIQRDSENIQNMSRNDITRLRNNLHNLRESFLQQRASISRIVASRISNITHILDTINSQIPADSNILNDLSNVQTAFRSLNEQINQVDTAIVSIIINHFYAIEQSLWKRSNRLAQEQQNIVDEARENINALNNLLNGFQTTLGVTSKKISDDDLNDILVTIPSHSEGKRLYAAIDDEDHY